jgi:AcrR family transcriptional regulator
MAKGGSGAGGGTAALPPTDHDLVIDAAFVRIAQQGWRRLSMAAIAAEAGVPILRVYRVFSSKQAILAGFFRRIDEAVLAAPVEAEPDERPRDRLFDLLMRRFDALGPYKEALEVLSRELPGDPWAALAAGARLLRSMRWMLEAADISTDGITGVVAVKLTAAAYLAAFRTWLRDDSPDLAPTMAALDRRLRGIERWLGAGRRGPEERAPASA